MPFDPAPPWSVTLEIPRPEQFFGLAIATADRSSGASNCEPPPTLAASADPGDTYLKPTRSDDGVARYVHVTESDMPWRIAVGRPRSPPRYGSTADAVRVTKEGMRAWESALRPHLPWFRLEFVEEDPSAPVQVEWKRRVPGPWGGLGAIRWWNRGSCLRVGGRMQISVRPATGVYSHLTVDELRELVAHEFGHVLGLGHCFECSSIMNYEKNQRTEITDLDVRTFLRLVEIPNGASIAP
ncbi:MAG: hypothetical protein CL910_14465 [Deltaproteobacteria bacterium]|jgi:hypothetical protein|nr:hypothetical protein [Deltaproteobacteria bacterium]